MKRTKYSVRRTNAGWVVYAGRTKLATHQDEDAAAAQLLDLEHPVQTHGVDKNPVTGEMAPAGYCWIQNLVSKNYVLVNNRTPWTLTVASETYWSA